MRLSEEQLTCLHSQGFLVLPDLFSGAEVDALRARLPALFTDGHEGNIVVRESGEVGTSLGLHLRDECFSALRRHPRLVEPALQILGEPAYIQQVKVNVKAAFSGKFGLDLAGRPATLTVRGRCRSKDGKVHTDSRSKLITALIYLNDDWSGGGGQLRLLRSNNIEDVIAEVPPHAGTLICFRNRENAWHGHTSYEGPRRALQLNWVVDDAAARKSERRHGVSAFLKNFSFRSFFAGK